MKVTTTISGLEVQYCKSFAAALLARTEFFELLEDAMSSPARLARARATWRQFAAQAQAIKGLVATA